MKFEVVSLPRGVLLTPKEFSTSVQSEKYAVET